jgi:hypothetical protein
MLFTAVCIGPGITGMASTIDHCISEVPQPLIRQLDISPTVRGGRIGRHTVYIHLRIHLSKDRFKTAQIRTSYVITFISLELKVKVEGPRRGLYSSLKPVVLSPLIM